MNICPIFVRPLLATIWDVYEKCDHVPITAYTMYHVFHWLAKKKTKRARQRTDFEAYNYDQKLETFVFGLNANMIQPTLNANNSVSTLSKAVKGSSHMTEVTASGRRWLSCPSLGPVRPTDRSIVPSLGLYEGPCLGPSISTMEYCQYRWAKHF